MTEPIRTKIVTFRLTPEEFRTIKAQKLKGERPSDVLRRLIQQGLVVSAYYGAGASNAPRSRLVRVALGGDVDDREAEQMLRAGNGRFV